MSLGQEAQSACSLVATALPGSQVRLDILAGGSGRTAIDSKRGTALLWEQIGVTRSGTYFDARPPLIAGEPEVRQYRCQGMENNDRSGAMSEAVLVVTVP